MEKIINDVKHLWNDHRNLGAVIIVLLVIALIL
jgi:hypothetical protein